MSLEKQLIDYIQDVVKICRLVDIDSVAIEPEVVRGTDEQRSVVILQNLKTKIPKIKIENNEYAVGLSRLDTLQSRLDIARSQDKFTIEPIIKTGTSYIHSLLMKAKGMKIDFRCMDPTKIKAPINIKDTLIYKIQLAGDAVALLQKAMGAMGADEVTVISDKDGVSFEVSDITSDVFKHTFTQDVELLDQNSDKEQVFFAYRYPIKTLLSIFKENPVGYFEIGARGPLRFTLAHDISIYVLPRA